MKQKRIYKVVNVSADPDIMNFGTLATHDLLRLCVELAECSDRAFPLRKQRVRGFVDAMNLYEGDTLFFTAERDEQSTNIQIKAWDDCILHVIAQREATNE